jgi:CheY-like chemotaxis protein
LRVLLIEDQQLVRKMVRNMLERSGHEVTEAENGLSGIDQLKHGAFELVITDIVMPEMDGIEMLTMLRQQYPDLKTIAMSGGGRTSNSDLLRAAKEVGVSAVLHKPFTLASLTAAIEMALDGRQVS